MGVEGEAVRAGKHSSHAPIAAQARLARTTKLTAGASPLISTPTAPPRGKATTPSATRLSKSLTLFFGSVAGGPCQVSVCFAPCTKSRHPFSVAKVDLGAGRSRRAEGKSRKLQLGRGL